MCCIAYYKAGENYAEPMDCNCNIILLHLNGKKYREKRTYMILIRFAAVWILHVMSVRAVAFEIKLNVMQKCIFALHGP